MRAGLGLAAAALVLLLPAAAAAPAEAQLRLQAPLDMAGDVALRAGEGVLVLPPLGTLPTQAERLNVTLVRAAARPDAAAPSDERQDPLRELLAKARDPLAAPAPGDEVRYLEVLAPESLTFTHHQRPARALLAVGPFDEGGLGLEGPRASVRESTARAAGALPATYARDADAAWLAAAGPGHAMARGTVRGLFEGVALVVQNATATFQVDTTDHRDGARWTALLRWTGAAIDARSSQPFTLLAPSLALDLDGTLAAARAWGGLEVDEAPQKAAGQALQAQGAMRGTLKPGGGSVAMRAQGDLAYLTLGDQRQDFARAAAAGAGLALMSALAYYGQHLRLLAVPLYARIAPSELLDNEVRRRVHGHIHANPGADVKGTAAAVEVSWSTAAYHLARLEREGVLTSRRAGRSKRFFVNGGAVTVRAEAIGALRNPTAHAIARLVASRPGLMQKEIGAALGLPASTVSWHMRRLRDLGVVREERRWRRAEYAPGPLWRELDGAVSPEPAAAPAPAPAGPASSLPPSSA